VTLVIYVEMRMGKSRYFLVSVPRFIYVGACLIRIGVNRSLYVES